VEGLEDEAHLVPAKLSEAGLREPVESTSVEPKLAGTGPVEPTQQVQQRRLSASTRPHDGQGLPADDIEIDCVDGAHEPLAAAVLLA
jgi:hypothetical protein